MATITTSTANTAFSQAYGYPPGSMVDVDVTTGNLWACARTTGTTVAVFKSTDKGISWSAQGSFTRANLQDLCEIRVDANGENIHMVYFISDTVDRIYYKRLPIVSGTPDYSTGEILVSSGGGTSTPQSSLLGATLMPICNPDGSYSIVIARSSHGSSSAVSLYAVSVKNNDARTTYTNNGLLVSTRSYSVSGDDNTIVPTIDVEHNGDGITASKPNLWLAWQIFGIAYCIKLTFQGYKTGWTTPASAYTIASGRNSVRDLPARWDGKRFVVASTSPNDTTKIDIYERPASNSGSSTKRTSPSHPVGTIGANMMAYNHVTQDTRLFGVSGSGAIYFVDYVRATNTWGAWTLASSTSPVTSEWGVRRGTAGTFQYDVYMESGGASPWTLSNVVLAVNFAPTAPTWLTGVAGTVTQSGAAFDTSQSLTLDWVYNDPNLTDAQAQYALSRQIGTGTVQWWRTSDSTWQAVETFNSSATSAVTLTTAQWLGSGGAADPAHVYKVATKDSGGLTSAYSSGLSVVPSTRVDPTLTAPSGGPILNTGTIAPTWTVSEQGAYRVVVVNTVTSAVVYDSGFQTDPTPATPSVLGVTVPVVLPDGFAGQVQLTTRNAEGLASVTRTGNFTIDFVEPVTPVVSALVAAPGSGGIMVTLGQAAASGAQPITTQLDLWRRVAVNVAPVNVNPYFETNTADWSQSNFATMARSTAQFHQGGAALLLTPNGTAVTPKVISTTYAVTTGTRWEYRIWMRATTANKTLRMTMDWYNGVTYSNTVYRDLTPVAGTWIYGWFRATVPAGIDHVAIGVEEENTPAVGDTFYIDEAVLIQANDDPGIRIASGVTSGVALLDWRAVTGVNYEYQGYAEAGNATNVWGPWSS